MKVAIAFFRLSLNLLSLVISIFFFRISDFIIQLNNIDQSIRWAIDLTFNTMLLGILLEVLLAWFHDSSKYTVSVEEARKKQNNLVLKPEESYNPLSVNCKITLDSGKAVDKTKNQLILNFSSWLSIQVDNDVELRGIVKIDRAQSVIYIELDKLFNHKITNEQTQTIKFKVMPEKFNGVTGQIQAELKKGKILNRFFADKKNFKLKILE
ncbi:hypothetical protein [Shouchella shacheensis]|uniref:hypothetical protein n=1 Tax=Shouchella shacheensis TaxID=1649580 RepID=UPI00073FEFA1|nr:hypothetical protein [Shouchella shacheensis]